MFDPLEFVADVQAAIDATKRSLDPEIYQQEFYYSLLKAKILKLPEDWQSRSQLLILERRTPTLEEIVIALSKDSETFISEPARRTCIESLLRYALVLIANEKSMRSSGPGCELT